MRVLGRAVAMSLVGIVAAGLAVVATPVPAVADTCGPGAGVSVVVDFRELGGGLHTHCDAGGGGKSAAALFADSGYGLTYATRQPGFVCRVSGVPGDDPCVNTSPVTAYWGLYWSDGSNGSWAYSSRGADSLIVPAGGSVAFAWQGSGQRGAPTVSPPVVATPTPTTAPTSAPSPTTPTSGTATPTTKPTTKPTASPTKTPTKTPTSAPTSSGTVTTTPSESPSTTDPGTPTESPTDSPTESPTESPTGEPSEPSTTESATSEPSESETTEATETPTDATVPPEARTDEESSRVPTWLTVAILVMLLLAIGMSAYAARRRTRA